MRIQKRYHEKSEDLHNERLGINEIFKINGQRTSAHKLDQKYVMRNFDPDRSKIQKVQ